MYYGNTARTLTIKPTIYSLNRAESKEKHFNLRKEFIKVRYIFESIFATMFFLSLMMVLPVKDYSTFVFTRKLLEFALFGSLLCFGIKNYHFLKGSAFFTLIALLPGINILFALFVFLCKSSKN